MIIIQLFNRYRSGYGGEFFVVKATKDILEKNGHKVFNFEKDSNSIATFKDKAIAFGSSIYSFKAKREFSDFLDQYHPDIVHVHNLYPLLSPSVLVAAKKRNIPVIMTVHNFGLTCPIGLHLYKSKICERCHNGREYWCLMKNCTGNIIKSINYSLRSAIAREIGLFKECVTKFIAPTEFVKNQMIKYGYLADNIVVIPHMIKIPKYTTNIIDNNYVTFAGRLCVEKGIDNIIEAGSLLPYVNILIVGDGLKEYKLKKLQTSNIEFLGRLGSKDMADIYRKSRFTIVPSICFEAFGLVAAEAMSYGLPVIASRIGGLSELVDNEITGFLVDPGNSMDLASKIRALWDNPELCKKMGDAGREKAVREFSENVYYKRIIDVYNNSMNCVMGK